ncbi:MAG: FHA domain-containing protein [Chloroflexi bacterium]|nr:FHA domain-containing protein [Chloroflexota bacterium]
MKSQLEIIEKRLQDFFENQLQNLGGKNLYTKITESVLQILHEKVHHVEEKKFAPNIYRVSLKSAKVMDAEEIAAFTDTLKNIITNVCLEESLNLSGPIHIQFFSDQKIESEFKTEVIFSTTPTRDTAKIFMDEGEKGKKESAITGYLISSTDEVFEIKNKITNIGRREDNELVVDNLLVSRLHAQIRAINGRHVLFDIDSTAGTKVNGQRIKQQALAPGDVIEIADYSLIYYHELEEKYRSGTGKITRKIS